jgi:hypothetical protein
MNKNRVAIIICFGTILMAACAPSPQAIQTALIGTQTAIAQTQEAQRTPLAEINLDPFLIQPGDLSEQYVSGQIIYQWPEQLPQTITPDNLIVQRIGVDTNKVNFGDFFTLTAAELDAQIQHLYKDNYLMIALYESSDNLEKAYQDIRGQGGSAEVGDKSTILVYPDSGYGFIVFTRCNALVAIEIEPFMQIDVLLPFAQRIDKRLKPLVCEDNP